MTMAIFGALIIVLNLITFASTRERVQPPPGERHPLSDDLKDVFTCRPWLVMFILTLLVFTMLVVRGSSSNYFFAYYLDQGQIREFLATVGLAGIGTGPVTGWKAALDGLGLLVKPDSSNAAAVGLSLFFVAREPRPDRRDHLLQAPRRPLRQEGGVHRGRVRDDPRYPRGLLRRPDLDRPALLAGHPVGRRDGGPPFRCCG